jgi:5-methylcytosine-specific restriction endonuclease McrA
MGYRTRKARKGLTEAGSTRAWREMREKVPGKPKRCPDGKPPFVDHKVPRRLGGKDELPNLRWMCGKNPGSGRPKGS